MEWKVKREDAPLRFKDKKGNVWKYISGKQLMERYPNGGYRIVADMKKRENSSEGITLLDQENQSRLYPCSRQKKRLERTAGYIDVSSEEYPDSFVRIRKSSLFRGLILPILLLIILIAAFFLGWMLSREEEVPGLDDTAVSYRVEGVRNTDPDTIALPGISILKMKAGSRTVEFPLINPEGNTCYMAYTIVDQASGETLYESGMIEPGKAVLNFDLNRTLEPGTYSILVQIKTNDLEDYTVELNGAEIPAELVVE